MICLAPGAALAQDAASEPGGEFEDEPLPSDPAPSDPAPTGELAPTGQTPPASDPSPSSPTTPDGERMRVLVVDAATFGIDPVVGRVTSARMRETAEALGYEVLGPDETVAAAQQLRMPYPPTPADLWRVSWVARVHRGAFARVWAHAGQYVIEITVASLDGGGPFFARGTAGADNLRDELDRLLRTALPSPSTWNAEGAVAAGTTAAPNPPGPSGEETPVDELDDFDQPSTGEGAAPATPSEPEPELRRWSLTLQTEAAIGASSEVFYNHLIGARLDFRITRDIMLGAYVAYANLNARNGRADNILMMLQFENRIRLSNDLDLTIPLRGAVGYLPFNGPVIRLSAGLNYALSQEWEIGVDLLTPTFWILPNRTAISLDIGIEVSYRF